LTIAAMVGLSPAETAKLIQKKNKHGEHRATEHDRPVAQIETKEANIHRTPPTGTALFDTGFSRSV
jgi:hypothetical protein